MKPSGKNIPKNYMEAQKILDSQNNLEKKRAKLEASQYLILRHIPGYSNKDTMVLA
jgi:hypothetical protein